MSDQPTVPTRTIDTDLGVLTATCTRPRRIAFTAGHHGTPPLTVNFVPHRCNLTVNRDAVPRDQRHRHLDLGGGWHVTRQSTWYALRPPGNGEATDVALRMFDACILPTLRLWLDTPDAQALLIDGHRYWQREFAHAAAETEADFVAAFQRLQAITVRVDRDEAISADDERFATRARVRLP